MPREKSAIKNAVTVSLTRPSSYHSVGILQLHILPFTYSSSSASFADFFFAYIFKSAINLEREENVDKLDLKMLIAIVIFK
jgi:hypothetical protein